MPIRRFYFLYFAAASALFPSFALLFGRRGFDGVEVGILTAAIPLTIAVATPLWGAAADRTGRGTTILTATLVVAALVGPALFASASLALALALVVVFAAALAPSLPFADATAMLAHRGGGRGYASLRAWGGIGWGLAAPLIGIAAVRLGSSAILVAHVVLTLALAWAGRALVVPGGRFAGSTRDALATVVRLPTWRGFLVAVGAFGFGAGVVSTYLFVRLASVGASAAVMGLALTIGTLSELVAFRAADRVIARIGATTVVLVGIGVLVVRLTLLGTFDTLALLLSLQLLHGLTFALPWSGVATHVLRTAPPELAASAQSVVGLVFTGLAPALGALVGGLLIDEHGADGMLVRAAAALAVAGVAIAFGWRSRTRLPSPATAGADGGAPTPEGIAAVGG